MAEQYGTPRPAWLEGLTPGIQVREIACRLADGSLLAIDAEPLMLRLLEEAHAEGALRPDGTHAYLSTSCLHAGHGYCQSPEGRSRDGGTTWAKAPAACKFCGAACMCGCHRGEAAGSAAVVPPPVRATTDGRFAILLADAVKSGFQPVTPEPGPPAEHAHLVGLRDRLNVALGESLDRCSRCKVCGIQLDAVMSVVAPVAASLAELENALNWQTTCTGCAALLDSSHAEMCRAEQAEAQLAVAAPALRRLALADPMTPIDADGEARSPSAELTARREHARLTAERIARLGEPGAEQPAHASVSAAEPVSAPPAGDSGGEPSGGVSEALSAALPLPAGEYARVELMGHNPHTGWVTDGVRAGAPVMVIRDWDGRVIAEAPGTSLYRFVPLPTPQKRPEESPEPRALAAPAWVDPDDDDDPDDYVAHAPHCNGEFCNGECFDGPL